MRDSHRGEAERLLVRAVEEEVRRSGGRTDGVVLLGRARAALDTMAQKAAEEYEAYTRALDESEAGRLTFGQRYAKEGSGTPLLVAAVAAGTAVVADLSFGVDAGTAVSTGVIVGIASAVATVLKVTASHLPANHHRAGALGQPGGPEQLRLQWLTALEVRGIRPFLDQQRVLAASTAKKKAPQLRGADKSAAARRRNVLEQSFAQLPETDHRFADRRAEMGKIRQWVQAARAETETRPTVVVLHGAPGSGRTALAVRATHELRDYFRGACVVDLRADSPEETPLSTRDALMHLLNRLGAPRDQLLFRERTSQDQQVKRLSELYHQHLTALPVTIVLDDASDPEQVRILVPERSDSLVLVTARTPLALPADLPAWVHQLPVEALDGDGAHELLSTAAQDGSVLTAGAPSTRAPVGAGAGASPGTSSSVSYDAESVARIRQLCGGLPLALRVAGSSLGPRTPGQLAADLGAYGPVEPIERALWLRYTDQSDPSRRLLRRLALAGRASLGAAAAASLLATDETEATRHLTALARAGLIDHVHGNRYRLHDMVRAFAHARLLDEEEPSERTAAQERLIVTYADLADSVLRLVDGNMSTRSDRFGQHGFVSLDEALRWLDDETSFITSTLRHAEGVNQAAVLSLLGALCDYCLLRGDLYRLGELNELAQSVDQGLLTRSVQWRTGIAARQLGELDKARTTLTSVVGLYMETNHDAGAARALCSLGITLHHQGNLTEAAEKLLEALQLQSVPELAADRAWTMHALAAVERDRAHLADALDLLTRALVIHRQQESLHGEGWAYFQLGQLLLRMGEVPRAESELRTALDLFGRTRDARGQAWSMTQLARARLVAGDPSAAVDGLRQALSHHRDNEDARGEAWTGYYLGQALEETGNLDQAVRELERSRTAFSRMRDVYGLACARHHSARVTRDQRAVQTGSLRNSGFARQLLVDARADFQRIGVAHGEAWTCLELAVVDAGNTRTPQALALCDEAARLFTSYGDRRGEDWARFLRCTLLPYAAPGGVEIGTAVAEEELAQLSRTAHPLRDEKLAEYVEAYRLLLERGVNLEGGWRAWTLGMVPNRHAREVMGVPVTGGQG
ncbi:tetratricopeptide repeat protein [Streptomyces sp. DSM 40750]|uniref:tetratricopeptide repeat protein n=1 Tax=Streptomyces sp. DSM 40750 TaxID=2801030 RepID=UPI00214CA4E9|nr:tetratricopeptide repeat protein [Streptomyces sp. DSM 40750]UUU24615.1 tetratricopeptide repeat protein [Streptomyces sp. DSM 40750]